MKSSWKGSKLRDWIRENSKKAESKDDFIKQCMDKFSINRKLVRGTINDMLDRGEELGSVVSEKSKSGIKPVMPKPRKIGNFKFIVSADDIVKEYDEGEKIEEGIRNLGNNLIKDNDFRIELGVSFDRWKIFSNLPKFDNNKQELKGKIYKGMYWGSVSVIRELRRKINIL